MRLAFVDLETTGGSPAEDRITEVGIIEVDLDDSAQPVRQWSTLVNPGVPISPFIETLTSITNAMVAAPPRFEAVADEILARLDGRLFIAHNARFDHGFLKYAFRQLKRPFRPPCRARYGCRASSTRATRGTTSTHRSSGTGWCSTCAIAHSEAPAYMAALEETTRRTAITADSRGDRPTHRAPEPTPPSGPRCARH